MMIKQALNPPNWFTSASLFCGLYAILLAGQAQGDLDLYYQAGLMIFFAGVFDMLDGRVARMTGTGTAFGVQLDSLVDIISFGVAPACLVYFWGLSNHGPFGVFVSGALMLAGAFRLARFNVLADGKAHKWSLGLTITMGGGTVSSVVMWHARSGVAAPADPTGVILFVLAVAFLQVSSVPYRTMKTFKMSPKVMAAFVVFAVPRHLHRARDPRGGTCPLRPGGGGRDLAAAPARPGARACGGDEAAAGAGRHLVPTGAYGERGAQFRRFRSPSPRG
jgi:CDP-diacylglycerol--serine O-phosphatidyltransferase